VKKAKKKPPATCRGNYVVEWFGFRVWGAVDTSATAVAYQTNRNCPFLSIATRQTTECVKAARGYDEPTGVCTISSDSNATRQDWLACPFRILDQHFTLLGGAVRSVYGVPDGVQVLLFPTTVLDNPERQNELRQALNKSDFRAFAFAASKLGGEVDVPETDASPGGKVDVSVIEILACDKKTGVPSRFGKHLFFEIQTADFHGSPLHAVRKLAKKCPRGARVGYHKLFKARPDDCGERVEGPNKANIFKRTIYQMVLKMELTRDPTCAGFVIVLPVPVWDSWLRHLGQPTITPVEGSDIDSLLTLDESDSSPGATESLTCVTVVFDIDRDSEESPQPLKIVQRISVQPEALIHFAFKAAPQYAINHDAIKRFREVLQKRVTGNWGE